MKNNYHSDFKLIAGLNNERQENLFPAFLRRH